MMAQQPSWIGYTLSNRYKIESLLGSGGMATVYKAFDPNLQRHVAIKLIHSHLAQQPEFVRRFEHEAAAVAKLYHPHIVPVYDFNHDQGLYYMVLAYLTGGSLERRLEVLQKVGRHLPLSETIDFMVKICEAVDYAHRQHIIHRDIKPGNVLFDQNAQPCLTDFGIARLAGNQQTMTVVGTPAYMSPEQIRGDQELDQRSDIYSLGIMLYEMASGKPPFEGGLGTLMLKHMQEPVPDVRLLNNNIPDSLVGVIEKALAKKPSDRFQSAAEMATALRSRSVSSDPSVPVTTAPSGRAFPATVPAATAPPATASPAPPPTAARKRPIWIWVVGLLLFIAVAIGGVAFSGILTGSSSETETSSSVTPSSEEVAEKVVEVVDEPTAISTVEVASDADVADLPTENCPDEMALISDGKFCLDIHEVTNAAYKTCVDAGACDPPQNTTTLEHGEYYANPQFDNYPVVWIDWNQANAYCQFATKRLPSASEWEQAAQNLEWPPDEKVTSADDTQAVQTAPQDVTPEGIYDLAGNVSEWVDESDGSRKVIKGNRFNSNSSHNESILPATADRAIGFRCATNIP